MDSLERPEGSEKRQQSMTMQLDKPLTSKERVSVAAKDHRFVISSMQGWPTTMEDAHCAVASLDPPFQDWSFYAVFDGHAGSTVANYASQLLVKRISEAMKLTYSAQPVLTSKKGQSLVLVDAESLSFLIKNCFHQLDDEMRELESLKGEDKSGSTAVAVLLSPDHFYVINCGDSRAVLVRDGKLQFSTAEHKPSNYAERKRIEAAGGSVIKKRVNGLLAVSRALGDFDYKGDHELGPLEQLISADPDVEVIPRNSSKDHFVILASGGVWDTMTDEEAMAFTRSRLLLQIQQKYGITCDEVADTCLHKGSRDNITIGLILFDEGVKFDEKVAKRAKDKEDILKDKLRRKVSRIFNNQPYSGKMDMPLLVQLLSGEIEDIKEELPPGGGLAAMRPFIHELYYERYPDRKPPEDASSKTEESESEKDATQTQPKKRSQNTSKGASQESTRSNPKPASKGASGQKQPEPRTQHKADPKRK